MDASLVSIIEKAPIAALAFYQLWVASQFMIKAMDYQYQITMALIEKIPDCEHVDPKS